MTQCFETYPQYGEDTLGTKIKAFTVGLEDYGLPEIDYAFRHWLKENSKFPTPAEIGYIAKEHRKFLNTPNVIAKAAPPRERKVVPWFGKSYESLDEETRSALRKHIVNLAVKHSPERALEYCAHLKRCGYPDLSGEIIE